jgi:hypothetical protein
MDRNEVVGVGRCHRRSLAALLLALAVIAAACGDDAAEEPITGGEPLGSAAADCLAYDEATLLAQELAFDGTLVAASADGEQAIFEVHNWFRGGGDAAEVVLAPGGLLRTDAQALVGTALEVGERYLISSRDGVVWACGYSVTYDSDLAAEWAELFG